MKPPPLGGGGGGGLGLGPDEPPPPEQAAVIQSTVKAAADWSDLIAMASTFYLPPADYNLRCHCIGNTGHNQTSLKAVLEQAQLKESYNAFRTTPNARVTGQLVLETCPANPPIV